MPAPVRVMIVEDEYLLALDLQQRSPRCFAGGGGHCPWSS